MSGVVVVDASCAVRLAWGVLDSRDAIDSADEVIAPSLFAVEVANALWKHVRAGGMAGAEAVAKLRAAMSLCDRIEAVGVDAAAAALEGAVREGNPVHDLVYLNLAESEDARLATADSRLAALAAARGVEVVWA